MPYGQSDVDAFLRHIRPDWNKAARSRAWEKLQKINVSTLNELTNMNPFHVNQELANIGERKFSKSTLSAMTRHRSFFNNIGYSALRESSGTRLLNKNRRNGPSFTMDSTANCLATNSARRSKASAKVPLPSSAWTNQSISQFFEKVQAEEFWNVRLETRFQKLDHGGKLASIFRAWWDLVDAADQRSLNTNYLATLTPIHAFRDALRIQCYPLTVEARVRRMLQLDPSTPISLSLDDFAEIVYYLNIPLERICPSVVNRNRPNDGFRVLFDILSGQGKDKSLSLAALQGSSTGLINTMEHWRLAVKYIEQHDADDRLPGWLTRSSSDSGTHATNVLQEQAEVEHVRNFAREPLNSSHFAKIAKQNSADTFTRINKMANIKLMDETRSQKTERSIRGYLTDMMRQRHEISDLQGQFILATQEKPPAPEPDIFCRRLSQVYQNVTYGGIDTGLSVSTPTTDGGDARLSTVLLDGKLSDAVDAFTKLRHATRCHVLPVRKFALARRACKLLDDQLKSHARGAAITDGAVDTTPDLALQNDIKDVSARKNQNAAALCRSQSSVELRSPRVEAARKSRTGIAVPKKRNALHLPIIPVLQSVHNDNTSAWCGGASTRSDDVLGNNDKNTNAQCHVSPRTSVSVLPPDNDADPHSSGARRRKAVVLRDKVKNALYCVSSRRSASSLGDTTTSDHTDSVHQRRKVVVLGRSASSLGGTTTSDHADSVHQRRKAVVLGRSASSLGGTTTSDHADSAHQGRKAVVLGNNDICVAPRKAIVVLDNNDTNPPRSMSPKHKTVAVKDSASHTTSRCGPAPRKSIVLVMRDDDIKPTGPRRRNVVVLGRKASRNTEQFPKAIDDVW